MLAVASFKISPVFKSEVGMLQVNLGHFGATWKKRAFDQQSSLNCPSTSDKEKNADIFVFSSRWKKVLTSCNNNLVDVK
jgi:hypothetical protein